MGHVCVPGHGTGGPHYSKVREQGTPVYQVIALQPGEANTPLYQGNKIAEFYK